MKYIATNEIRWIDLQFFDIKGSLHRVSVSNRKLEEASFGSGINAADLSEVFGSDEQGGLVLLPDPDTLARLPWEPATVRLICDILVAVKKERFLKDSRYVAERMETNLTAAGIKN
jgi:glutamine synthetase